ncbi:uncharacterized protein LOC8068777 [Sorghum bicolor]|jgi:hypothetical protein|uniref:uncharacterized protein LOC8068777 n=1 Tax=Sorghum bicolor TaxID=4558 RepID=UPI000B4259AF|nr:uncharacterized protein LOC8068777 [Sorghum bicolor]|eukprot:XP_021304712.1 uncharacterized protein LOC8068777 [Sorghum bicolor]
MDDRRYSGLTKVGFGVMACSSALAVCKSWGGASSVAFVLVADAALVLLFACLRELDRRCRADGGAAAAAGSGSVKAAVWALTTLLTAMFAYASRVAPLLPLVVGAIIFLCLSESEWAQIGLGGNYAAELLKMGFGVVACDSALAHHHARGEGDAGSLAFVFFAYVGFLTLTWLFLRRFDGRARGAEQ